MYQLTVVHIGKTVLKVVRATQIIQFLFRKVQLVAEFIEPLYILIVCRDLYDTHNLQSPECVLGRLVQPFFNHRKQFARYPIGGHRLIVQNFLNGSPHRVGNFMNQCCRIQGLIVHQIMQDEFFLLFYPEIGIHTYIQIMMQSMDEHRLEVLVIVQMLPLSPYKHRKSSIQ